MPVVAGNVFGAALGVLSFGLEQLMDENGQSRLERIMESGFATLADLLRETNHRLDETNLRLERLEGRFDNFLSTAGGESRELKERVNDLERRVERLEQD